MRLWIGIASVIGAALLVAASAGAAPPDHFTDSDSYTGNASCGSFTNFWSGSFTLTGKTMFDKNGDPVMDVVHESGSELNWRSGNNDSYTVYFDYNIVYTYATDTTSLSGKVIKVSIPAWASCSTTWGRLSLDRAETWWQSTAPTTRSSKGRTRTATRSSRSRTERTRQREIDGWASSTREGATNPRCAGLVHLTHAARGVGRRARGSSSTRTRSSSGRSETSAASAPMPSDTAIRGLRGASTPARVV